MKCDNCHAWDIIEHSTYVSTQSITQAREQTSKQVSTAITQSICIAEGSILHNPLFHGIQKLAYVVNVIFNYECSAHHLGAMQRRLARSKREDATHKLPSLPAPPMMLGATNQPTHHKGGSTAPALLRGYQIMRFLIVDAPHDDPKMVQQLH